MSLVMHGMIDQTFGTGLVTITPPSGGYVDGDWVNDAQGEPTTHLATKQVASSEELRALPDGGERFTDVARFFISDGSTHSVGATLVDHNGKTYRIFDADCRPERHYCKLLGASKNG